MAKKIARPSQLQTPAFLMNFPFTVDNREPNNPLMTDRSPYDRDRAFRQWMELYKTIAKEALVYVMPDEGYNYQDLPYVANSAAFLPHSGAVLIANFSSEPRWGEEYVADGFFQSLGYLTRRPGYRWEGEADLKYISDRLYIGGYGIRTEVGAYEWMEEYLEMEVVDVKMTDPKLFHFDCLFFPVTSKKAIVATSALDNHDLKRIERHVDIVPVPKQYVYDGWTNAVRLNDKVLLSVPPTLKSRVAAEDMINSLGYEPVMIDLSEFEKSGADLSCLVCHLNFNGRGDDDRRSRL